MNRSLALLAWWKLAYGTRAVASRICTPPSSSRSTSALYASFFTVGGVVQLCSGAWTPPVHTCPLNPIPKPSRLAGTPEASAAETTPSTEGSGSEGWPGKVSEPLKSGEECQVIHPG